MDVTLTLAGLTQAADVTLDLKAILFDLDDTLFDRQGVQLMMLDVIARAGLRFSSICWAWTKRK